MLLSASVVWFITSPFQKISRLILVSSTIAALPLRSFHTTLVIEHLEHHTYIRRDEIDSRTPREQRMGPGVRLGRPAVISHHRINFQVGQGHP